MKNIKKILIAVLSFSLLFAISCDNEGKTGGGGTGGGAGGGGGVSGGGNGGSGEVEILTPEEGTYNIAHSDDYYNIGITVKINEDNTVQISGKSSSINYKNFAETREDYNCKTSDWTKQSGTDYKISKSIVSERIGNYYMETTMNNAEVKWRYLNTNGYKHIELDLNYENGSGRPFRSVALKRAAR